MVARGKRVLWPLMPVPVTGSAVYAFGYEREKAPAPEPAPTLAALGSETRQELRVLAERSLDALGVRERGPFVESEMLRLFGTLAPSVGSASDREAQLRLAIRRAMTELD